MKKMDKENNLPPQAILAVAIRSEMEAADVYLKLHEHMKSTLLKEKLKFLLSEERRHRQILERLFSQKFPDQKLEIPKKSLLPRVKVRLDEKSSVLDLFNAALSAEKSLEDFYKKSQ